jgi:hypothetical protein
MDPVTIIVAALAAGAAAGVTDVASQAIKDGYAALKGLIIGRFGQKADIKEAVEQVEKKPDSEGRKATLQEELQAAGAGQDQEVVQQARAFLDMLKDKGALSQASYSAILAGSGAIAQDHSVAAGAGGTAIGAVSGDFYGSVPGARPAQQAVPPYTPDDPRASLQQQLGQHRRTLQHLAEQKSQFSSGYVPVHLLNQIESEEQQIERLEQALAALE